MARPLPPALIAARERIDAARAEIEAQRPTEPAPDVGRVREAAVEAWQAIEAFEGVLRAECDTYGVRAVAWALGVPHQTVHRWRWHHSELWGRLMDRLGGQQSRLFD